MWRAHSVSEDAGDVDAECYELADAVNSGVKGDIIKAALGATTEHALADALRWHRYRRACEALVDVDIVTK